MRKKFDVIVVGGGLTGVCAAIAAARQNQKVLLIEQEGALGGAPVNCLVTPFMPFHTKLNGVNTRLNQGLVQELLDNLEQLAGDYKDRVRDYCPSFNEEHLKIVLDRMCKKAKVTVLFHAMLCKSQVNDEHIKSIQVACSGQLLRFKARTFIDATGDADLAYMAGCPIQLGRESDNRCQPMTLCFRVVNVDTVNWDRDGIQKLYKELQAKGKIKNPRENVLMFFVPHEHVVHFNSTRVIKHNPVDPLELSKAEAIAREQMLELFNMLKKNFVAFKDATLFNSGISIGVRESRMIIGKHVLNEQELKDCTKFEDRICAGNYDIDIHSPDGSGTSHYYFKDGEYYTIPYRCLIPQKVNNLLVAGRCISSTHEAQASYRIMPIVSALGEAAGVAAGVANNTEVDVADADYKVIQEELLKAGAFIG